MSKDVPFAWAPGMIFERPSLLFSDGGIGLSTSSEEEESLRDEMREQNERETDPAHMLRFGVVRVEVLSIEDPRPAPAADVWDLLTRVRAMPRLPAALRAEIDAVLARADS